MPVAASRAPTRAGCPFCGIVQGEVHAHTVMEDETVVVFLDRRPVFFGHCLVVPGQALQPQRLVRSRRRSHTVGARVHNARQPSSTDRQIGASLNTRAWDQRRGVLERKSTAADRQVGSPLSSDVLVNGRHL